MSFDFNRLLDPTPMRLEMGYERLETGVLRVSVRTDMRGCSGAMFEWWFGSRPGTREYRWWHPKDHLASDWRGGTPGQAIGSTHVAEEWLTQLPPIRVNVQFRDPAEAFSIDGLVAARAAGHLSGIVYANVGIEDGTPHAPDEETKGSRLMHLCRDTHWGTVLRSTFLMGQDLPDAGLGPDQVAGIIPDAMGPALVQHCYDEMTFLSHILPSLYRAEGIPREEVKLPW